MVFLARDVEVKVTTTTTIGSNSLPSYFSSASTVTTAKTCEIDEGEQDFEAQYYLGLTTGNFQNQGKINKPKGPATLTVTFDAFNYNTIAGFLYDSSNAISSGTRYVSGTTTRKEAMYLVYATNGTDKLAYVLNYAQQTGPATKVTGTDGNIEYELKVKCLPKDFVGPEFIN
jgi:hypothetical protein